MSGVATTASKSSQLSSWIFATMSSPPTKSAPASCASFSFSPEAIDQDLLGLAAEPVREDDGATHHLVGVLRIHPEPHRHLDRLVELREGGLGDDGDGLGQRLGGLARHRLPGLLVLLSGLVSFDSFRTLVGALPPAASDRPAAGGPARGRHRAAPTRSRARSGRRASRGGTMSYCARRRPRRPCCAPCPARS